MKPNRPVQPRFGEPSLPADFPRRVIARAHFEQRRTRFRHRLAAAGGAGLLAVTFAFSGYLRGFHPNPRSAITSDVAYNSWDRSDLTAETNQLALAAAPDQLDDYLLPSAASLTAFDSDPSYASADQVWQDTSDPSAWSSTD